MHAPGTKPPAASNLRTNNRAARLANAVTRSSTSPGAASQMNITNAPAARGMTIRGLAGPFVVIAQNFAPGTTAADIESAMAPIGGLVSDCRLIKTQPIVIAEIVFESREGADRAIQTFNNQTVSLYPFHQTPNSTPKSRQAY